MGLIHTLDAHTRSLIAAGEVVERPASVVRELCDNAVDAGAGLVRVDIAEGGLSCITVVDDGCGMSPEDAAACFGRHATSKLRAGADLMDIGTLGFRGEALASIAAIAEVELTTCQGNGPGTRVVVRGDTATPPTPANCPQGTRFEVRDLFFNAPARRAFMKSPGAETTACLEQVQNAALAHPEVAFRLTQGGDTLFATHGQGGLDQVFAAILGCDRAQLVPVEAEGGGWRVSGFAGVPERARGNRSRQVLLMGGRVVKHAALTMAAERAYEGLLAYGRYPVFVLQLTWPAGEVDVNVHPAKIQVRIHEERQVASLCHHAVKQAIGGLHSQGPVQALPTRQEFGFAPPSGGGERREPAWSAPAPAFGSPYSPPAAGQPLEARQTPNALLSPELGKVPPKYIGQAFEAFLIFEHEGTLYWMDTHAAHERLLFDRYAEQLLRQAVPRTRLLLPIEQRVSAQEAQALALALGELDGMGFSCTLTDDTLTINTLPAWLSMKVCIGIAEQIAQQTTDATTPLREAVMRLSCRRAIKAGQPLSAYQAAGLLADCLESGVTTCPHGRPIFVEMTRGQLDSLFARKL